MQIKPKVKYMPFNIINQSDAVLRTGSYPDREYPPLNLNSCNEIFIVYANAVCKRILENVFTIYSGSSFLSFSFYPTLMNEMMFLMLPWWWADHMSLNILHGGGENQSGWLGGNHYLAPYFSCQMPFSNSWEVWLSLHCVEKMHFTWRPAVRKRCMVAEKCRMEQKAGEKEVVVVVVGGAGKMEMSQRHNGTI